jgi:hypothetical protein
MWSWQCWRQVVRFLELQSFFAFCTKVFKLYNAWYGCTWYFTLSLLKNQNAETLRFQRNNFASYCWPEKWWLLSQIFFERQIKACFLPTKKPFSWWYCWISFLSGLFWGGLWLPTISSNFIIELSAYYCLQIKSSQKQSN